MQAAEIAQFFASKGNRVIRTRSCYWYNPQPLMYRSLPVHRFVSPSPVEIAKVLMLGPAGGMFVCRDRNYDFPSLSQNVRSRTRRGLARCRIERISFPFLAEHGH